MSSTLRAVVRHGARWGATTGTVGALLVGCAGSAAAATGPRVIEAKYGFSFSLPPNWRQVPLTGSDVDSILDQATKHVPGLRNALSAQIQQAEVQGLKVFALGPVEGDFFPNINVSVQSSSGEPTGKAFLAAADAQAKIALTQVGVDNLRTSDTRLPFGPALEASYILHVKDAAIRTVVGVQLYVEHKAHIYVVTISGPTTSANQPVVRTLEASWRWR
jgi:hypothetical protein